VTQPFETKGNSRRSARMMRVSFVLAAILFGIILFSMKSYLLAETIVLIVALAVIFSIVMFCLLTLIVLDEFADRNYLRIKARIDKSRVRHVPDSAIGKP
jgi:hypothetical protein